MTMADHPKRPRGPHYPLPPVRLKLRLCRLQRGHAVVCAKALRLAGEVHRPKPPQMPGADAWRSRQSALVLVANRQQSYDALGSGGDVGRGQGAVSEKLERVEGVGEDGDVP